MINSLIEQALKILKSSNMSDDDLWKNAKAFKELNEDFNNTKAVQIASLPEFKRDLPRHEETN